MSKRIGVGESLPKLEPPIPLLPSLSADQQAIESAVESPLVDFLAGVKDLPPLPQRLLLILFEYRWAVPLLGERDALTSAIQSMEKGFQLRDLGYSIKDLDALEEIFHLIGGDRKRRRADVIKQRLAEVTESGVKGNRRRGKTTRDWVIKRALDLKAAHPRLTKSRVAEMIANEQGALCGVDRAKKILKGLNDDPWKNKVG